MRESVFETLTGFCVLVLASVFVFYALGNGSDGLNRTDTYDVTARFNNIVGIDRGSDVRMAGVKIGIVKSIDVDFQRVEAVLRLSLDEAVELPDDTDARISSDGLLGGAYIALEPGGGFDMIAQDGTGEILYTRGSVDLMTLIGSFANSLGTDSNEGADSLGASTGGDL
mgnify:CR=1 FL=1